jgi:hypothetical protein
LRSSVATLALGLAGSFWGGQAPAQPQPFSGLHFVDRTAEAGLDQPIWCGREGKPHILESGGSGLALFDYDLDGDLDIYLVNGWRLDGREIVERGRNILYANRGNGRFEDVSESSGTDDNGWGTGVAVADFDGDGTPDLFVANFGRDVLYANRGDGSFARVEDGPTIDGWSTGAVFFDADNDGDADLYVAAYIDCTEEEVLNAEPGLLWEGIKVMVGPFGLEGKANRYFENQAGGRFVERTEEAGLADVGLFYSFGVAAVDLDGDLDLDLYVANDSNPNYLYESDGAGHFQEVGLWSGAALDRKGNAQAGMGLAAGDLDSDGLADLFVTNFHTDVSTMYRNLGDLLFEDITESLGLRDPTYRPLSWGTSFSDLDLDGRLDLFIANGHIYPQADRVPETSGTFRQRNALLRGGAEGFRDVTASAGPGLAVVESSRGLATGDLDGDGDLDLVISNMDAPPTLLINESHRSGTWLMVDEPRALRATVESAERRIVRHRIAGGSYVSVDDWRFHFGLGQVSRVNRLRLVFDDGKRVELRNLPVDRLLVFPR